MMRDEVTMCIMDSTETEQHPKEEATGDCCCHQIFEQIFAMQVKQDEKLICSPFSRSLLLLSNFPHLFSTSNLNLSLYPCIYNHPARQQWRRPVNHQVYLRLTTAIQSSPSLTEILYIRTLCLYRLIPLQHHPRPQSVVATHIDLDFLEQLRPGGRRPRAGGHAI